MVEFPTNRVLQINYFSLEAQGFSIFSRKHDWKYFASGAKNHWSCYHHHTTKFHITKYAASKELFCSQLEAIDIFIGMETKLGLAQMLENSKVLPFTETDLIIVVFSSVDLELPIFITLWWLKSNRLVLSWGWWSSHPDYYRDRQHSFPYSAIYFLKVSDQTQTWPIWLQKTMMAHCAERIIEVEQGSKTKHQGP